jgi:hypothetical protein
MNPADFQVPEGAPIRRALARFARLVLRESRVSVEGPARIRRTAEGRIVVYEPPAPRFPGSFRVRRGDEREVTIGDGLASGLVPRIEGIRIDGLDDEGEPVESLAGGRPALECEGPGPDGRSYVALAAVPGELGEIDPEREAPLEVIHVTTLPPRLRDEEGRVLRLLAALEWEGREGARRIARIRQIVWYDQELYLAEGEPRWRAAS